MILRERREGKSEQGNPMGAQFLPPYAAPTDIDTQATNIATEHKLGRGHELGAADPLSRSSAPTSKVRGLGFRTRLGEHGLASLTHAPQPAHKGATTVDGAKNVRSRYLFLAAAPAKSF